MKYDSLTIGARALSARNNKNITQTELSEHLGISQATISKFENGTSDIPSSKLFELCNYLGISLFWLVGDNSLPQLTDTERLELENYIKFIISKRNK
ncbi:MAG TPA: helix-turn-helix transcriptional regulator [Mobilitalea sp.]|nr:helix-turn-helix transcriptional regulator [Mobilitalea sp.]